MNIPRFSLPLAKINYAALISRAYYFYKKDYILKEKKKKKSKDMKEGEGGRLQHMKTGISLTVGTGGLNNTLN